MSFDEKTIVYFVLTIFFLAIS